MRSATTLAACLSAALLASPLQAAEARAVRIAATAVADLAPWDDRIASLLQSGDLRVRQVREDTLLPGREHQRLAQFHRGLPVFGGEIVRQTDGTAAISVFGTFYEGIAVDTRPTIGAERASDLVRQMGAHAFGSQGSPQLVILPSQDGTYTLTWKVRAWLESGDIRLYFLDAKTGVVAFEFSDLQTQAVGTGTGVLNDQKKISAREQAGAYVTDDRLRPPAIFTYDFKGNLLHLFSIQTVGDFSSSDLARDSDNTWTDGAVVDAHAYAGYTYDYFFKRFGRHGLDNRDIAIRSVVHPVRREDIFTYPDSIISSFYLNAFYAGDGLMVYGEGLPSNFTAGGKKWNYLAGALDVVAHELTHGVTDFSSRLIYQNQSGALNESFSDMMGIAAEFYHASAGNSPGPADYLLGEDVITPGGLRSMQNPMAYGDPDHYSLRYTGSQDNGGVHSNSGIPNHAYYLAIEGGTHRLSKVVVQGVGASNREQIEKVFYRAFTGMLPPSANFATARAATLQSAKDLYGAGSAVERAVSQAWTAVGVE